MSIRRRLLVTANVTQSRTNWEAIRRGGEGVRPGMVHGCIPTTAASCEGGSGAAPSRELFLGASRAGHVPPSMFFHITGRLGEGGVEGEHTRKGPLARVHRFQGQSPIGAHVVARVHPRRGVYVFLDLHVTAHAPPRGKDRVAPSFSPFPSLYLRTTKVGFVVCASA